MKRFTITRVATSLIAMWLLGAALAMSSNVARAADSPSIGEQLLHAKRVVFLGDSITAAGQYVAYVDVWLESQKLDAKPLIIDAGLPSETVSGLSEEGHAGGKFPRPDLAERLDRVLKATKPDLVFACYGINCGIYQSFDDERFTRYQAGMTNLKQKVENAGAKLILITPPFYDDVRAGRKEGDSYNVVLDRYADWLMSKRKDGWNVIDLHGPMSREVNERRKQNPMFTFQPDAVHPNAEGQWFVASQLIKAFGDEKAASASAPEKMVADPSVGQKLVMLVQQRVFLLRDSYVGAAGHKRPGVAVGLPIAEAEKRAGELTEQIRELLGRSK